MLGELLDGHDVAVLRNGEGVLYFSGDEVEIGLCGTLSSGLDSLDASLGLVDLEEVSVHGTHDDRIVDHSRSNRF